MLAKLFSILRTLFGLALLCLFGWLSYEILHAVAKGIISLQSDLAIAIVAAAASVLISVISLLISKYLEGRAVITQELRAKKTPIYEEIVSTLYGVLFAEMLGKEPLRQADLMQFFATATEKLTIWGSDGVLKAFRSLRLGAITAVKPEDSLFLYEDFILEIRRDLGHKNKGFKKGTVLGLFINDIDQYLK